MGEVIDDDKTNSEWQVPKELTDVRKAIKEHNLPTGGGAVVSEASQDIESEDSEIRREIEALGKDNHLLVHQTAADSAASIMMSDYFGVPTLDETAKITEPENVISNLKQVDSNFDRFAGRTEAGADYGHTHKDAHAAVIMAIPKAITDDIIDSSSTGKFEIRAIDEYLLDRVSEGKQGMIGLPNQFIFGYYYDRNLVKNPNFDPTFS